MREYHTLTVTSLIRETPDSVRVSLSIPDELREAYRFLPGQHIPVAVVLDGQRLRRTYSLCSSPDDDRLEIGVRVQEGGAFSGFVGSRLAPGDQLEVMPPTGRFFTEVDPGHPRHVAAFAAGSGITPILSIVRAVLEGEPDSIVTLFYGNRTHRSTMFIDDLYALKNRYPDRLALHFLFSREEQEYAVMSGRLDARRTRELLRLFCRDPLPDTAYVCGPDTMIAEVTGALEEAGIAGEAIHAERFGVPRGPARDPGSVETSGRPAVARVSVTVIMDGHRRRFDMTDDGRSLVDAAAAAGIELPFSCKGGVCATCRTHLRSGEVRMDANYGLEPWEVENGFILACQSHPLSDEITLDYDRA
jgi:ring-1,2-phenylacetyl-CoA epoxidase subunit PaaE